MKPGFFDSSKKKASKMDAVHTMNATFLSFQFEVSLCLFPRFSSSKGVSSVNNDNISSFESEFDFPP